jgi:uncharacterized protein
MNNIAYFEIQAREPSKLVEFYKNVFGWEFTRDERLPIEYWRLKEGTGMNGAILQRPKETPPLMYGTNAYTCSVWVESYDLTAEKILAGGGVVAMEKFAIPGKCWQGYYVDLDHNVFGIFEADVNAK